MQLPDNGHQQQNTYLANPYRARYGQLRSLRWPVNCARLPTNSLYSDGRLCYLHGC